MTGLDLNPTAGFDVGDEAVAVVGLSGRFPGARDVGEFWANLSAGVESVEVLGEEELLAAGVGPEVSGRAGYVRAAPRFAGMGEFDAEFFGYSAREAQLMDPQHRVFLQEAWHALEDAGHDPAQFPGSIGVFAGASTSAYLENIFSNLNHGARIRGENIGLGFELAFLVARVSYKLDLRGPSVPVQTACSTALVAVHNACQSLLDYECDMALAGAVAYKVRENTGYLFREGGFLSADGHVRPFDAGARGTVFGSGVGVVVLRRLSDALADGDVVRAVLRGSAVNNDGAVKVSFTAPGVSGQAAVVAAALESAGLAPDDIDYIEAHGTGTVIGDSIEVQALSRVFAGSPAGSVGLGSLKGNVGHLDAAAGMAGLVKVILALRAEVIPASLHFERANPEAGLSSGPFQVVGRPRAWPRSPGRPRRAGVSAFGFGGTNAHVIVEEAPLPVTGEPGADAGHVGGVRERDGAVLVVSARSAGALRAVSSALADAVEALAVGGARERRLLGDVAFTLGTGRRALEWRRAVTGTDVASVVAALRSEPAAGPGLPAAGPAPRVVFVATGQGAQHCGMARALYAQEPVFAREFDRCAAWVAAADAEPDAGGLAAQLREELARAGLTGEQVAGSAELAGMPGLDASPGESWPPEDLPGLAAGGLRGGADLRWVVLADPVAGGTWAPAAARLLARTCWAQPALWCVEMALARLWQSWGIVPQAVVGHSVGEWTAASLAGVFDLRTAARLVVARGWLMQQQPAGAMATVLADPDEVTALLAGPAAPAGGRAPGLSVAARNGPGECVVSGPAELVAAFSSAAERRGWGVQPVPGGHGFHSALMDAAVPAFRDRVARELGRAAQEAGPGARAGRRQLDIPFTSNVTGGWITAEQACDPDYWARQIRAGVRFADNIATVLDGQPDTVLLEIGPGRALTSLIRRTLAARPAGSGPAHTALASLPHRGDSRTAADTVRRALADLWTTGLHPRWRDYYRHHPHHRLSLPTYPFQPTHHWLPVATPESAETPAPSPGGAGPLLDEAVLHGADESVYRTRFGLSQQWVLSEHKLLGEAIVPGTTYLEMAATAGEQRLGRPVTMIRDVTFYIPLLVTAASEIDVFITIRDAGDDHATFTVASRQAGERARDGWVTHARGTVSAGPLPPAEPLDPAALRARCRAATVDTGALQAEHRVMEFGPRWELSLQRVHVGVRSALGELALPAQYAAECAAYRLHPALLDLATGFGALAVLDSVDDLAELRGERDFYLPIGYDAIEIHRPLPARGLSQITPCPDQEAHARIRVVNVLVCDEDGQVALVIRGFTAGRVADPALAVTRLRPHQRHHRLRWEPAPAHTDADISFTAPVLIVGVSADRTSALAGELRSAGVTPRIALIDEAATDSGSADADGLHRLPPTATALASLMTRTAARHLVFVAAAATVADRPERMRAELDRGVYALFHLLKAAATGGGLDRLDIVAPTVRPVTGGERQLAPQHATLFGLAKAFAQEHGGCAVRCVDDDGDTAAVCAELRRASTTSVVALRDGARWVQVLAPADARDRENAKPADLTEDARNFLITGGLGGLGLAVAEHLSAQRPTARIALVGRSPAPAPEDWATLAAADAPAANTAAVGDRLPDVLGKRRRQARTLDAMRERGTDVRTFAADVADEAAMREIVTRITAEWGALDCVVHAAGVAGDGFLFRKDAETFAATVAPKVLGAAVLDSVTDGDVPPRIITFGSTVTVFGAAGQGDYTAANDYLAAFADARSARGRPTATLAWSDWLEVGMAVDNAVAEHQGFFRSLTLAEALSSFDLLAGGREPNTIIGEINTAKLGAVPPDDLNEQFRHAPVLLGEHVREVLARARRAASGTPAQDAPNETVAAPDVVLLGRDDGDYTPTERMLAGMWASELGLDRFDITASSFMLGGDSLTALRMATRIEKVMNISVSVIDIFQYETAAELAVFLDSQLPGADGSA